jgi:hypothetical protein
MSIGPRAIGAILFAGTLIFSGGSGRPIYHSRTIPLPDTNGTNTTACLPGRLDHFAYDPATHRLFVAAVEHGSLEVIDLDRGNTS